MSRTCTVRFEAMLFTLSVRSFQIPPTLGTLAWPPSLPSVPTSCATRVTSLAKTFRLSMVLLMVSAISLKSPDTGIWKLSSRLPRLIFFSTLPTSSTGTAMLSTRPLMLFTMSRQKPAAPSDEARAFRLPSTPATFEMRDTSPPTPAIMSTIEL